VFLCNKLLVTNAYFLYHKSFIFSTQIKIPADSTASILEDDFES